MRLDWLLGGLWMLKFLAGLEAKREYPQEQGSLKLAAAEDSRE